MHSFGNFWGGLGTFWSNSGMLKSQPVKKVEVEFPKSHSSTQFIYLQSHFVKLLRFSNQTAFSRPMQCYKCVSSRSQCDVPEQLLAEALLKKVCSENHFILTQKDCSENDATKYKINVYLKKRISIFASKTILQLNTDNNPNCRPPLIRNQTS